MAINPLPPLSLYHPHDVQSPVDNIQLSEALGNNLPLQQTVNKTETTNNDDNPLNSFNLDNHEEQEQEQEQERIKQIEQVLQQVNRSLRFHIDDDSGKQIATIVDKETGDIIRQVPAQELLDLNKNLAKHSLSSLSRTV
ncbi:flagellar biosynthesis protein FlaG [Photobacterium phosphoreum]|uniref:flagellar protein FlaG n=1 Tax=Photobacterium phosphoreum TaxID=659 RepID=UPI001E567DC3|nr:flagellar protein FlaG [Photobacterium phosphoreum]MCD9478195.1 flagellar biosynthesis protein FlaG [Photobacterium phosphoreum]MCD9482379.1 flagellar biosynthesis protein FlaG [Photobacterium phosphoreum]